MPRIIYINPRKKALISFVLTIFIIIAAILAFNTYYPEDKAVFASEVQNTDVWIGLIKSMLGRDETGTLINKPFMDKMLAQIAQTDITEPKKMIAFQMLAVPGKEEWYITEPEHDEILIPIPEQEKKIQEVPPVKKVASGKPLIGIYCTHNAENYALSDGVEKVEGKNGGVVKAAAKLKETLEDKGIGAVLDDTIHDYPDWPRSYSNSLKTARKLIKDYPSIEILIDVHRDAMPSREDSVTEIDGKKTARISFIVGSDTRLQHPNWRKNWAYANYLAEEIEKRYPGLLKTVRVQSGRYNQHVNPHSILIEVGSTNNSTEEAERAMEIFADVLAESLAARSE